MHIIYSDIYGGKEIHHHNQSRIRNRRSYNCLYEPTAFKIMLIASEEKRLNRIMKKFNINKNEALHRMEEIDQARENFTKTFAGVSRYDARNYDIVWNIGNFDDTESSVSTLAEIIRKRYNLK